MKKLILSAAMLGALSLTSRAQITVNPEAGINLANMTSKTDVGGVTYKDDTKMKIGLKVGGTVTIPVVKGFFVQPGAFYSMKGTKMTDNSTGVDVTTKLNFNTIEVPVNLGYQYDFGNAGGVFVTAGPYVGYAFSGKVKAEASANGSTGSYSTDIPFGSNDGEVKRFDYGLNFSAGYKLPIGVFVRAQYGLGLANLINGDGSTLKNKVLAFSVGYAIEL